MDEQTIFLNGMALVASYIGYHDAMKIFTCQGKLVFTDKENKVIAIKSLAEILMPQIDHIIDEQP